MQINLNSAYLELALDKIDFRCYILKKSVRYH
jgi:hypothetical protein